MATASSERMSEAEVLRRRQSPLRANRVETFLEQLFGGDLHAKRVLSLANATTGVLHAGALSIHLIGLAFAQVEGRNGKHAIKQVDRLLSNYGIDPWKLFETWVPFVVGSRDEVVVAMDWTEFDDDEHSVISLHLVTRHGRATPLLWSTVPRSDLKGLRAGHESALLERFKECLPKDVRVTVLADRGFGDTALYEHLRELRMDFVIRFRGDIYVTSSEGETRLACAWVPKNGRALLLRGAGVTANRYRVGAVALVHAPAMKEAWCLAASSTTAGARELVKLYGRRFTIEESFRDTKDARFGFGMKATHIGNPARRDRLFLISAFATVLLTLLGAAGERVGLDRLMRANTVTSAPTGS